MIHVIQAITWSQTFYCFYFSVFCFPTCSTFSVFVLNVLDADMMLWAKQINCALWLPPDINSTDVGFMAVCC